MTGTLPTQSAIPQPLRETSRWVCWREQTRDGKPTKVPIEPQTGEFASATDKGTWDSFDIALTYAESGNAAGVGFVFTADGPFVGVDLDDCRDPQTGEVEAWAETIIDQLDSYTEISPSESGFHVLVRGSLPGDRSRRGDVELYEDARFFTVTGDLVGDRQAIAERQSELAAVYEEFVQPEAASAEPAPEATAAPADTSPYDSPGSPPESDGVDLDDDTIIARAQRASNGEKFTRLWRGDTSGYDSHSEADMALCSLLAFWTGGDGSQVDRLFRDSGLMRQKWHEQHYADGRTYGEVTVRRAIAHVDDYYDPSVASDSDPDMPSTESHESPPPSQATTTATGHASAHNTEQRQRDATGAEPGTERGGTQTDSSEAPNVRALTARVESLEVEVRRLRDELATEREKRRELERTLDQRDASEDAPESSPAESSSWLSVGDLLD